MEMRQTRMNSCDLDLKQTLSYDSIETDAGKQEEGIGVKERAQNITVVANARSIASIGLLRHHCTGETP